MKTTATLGTGLSISHFITMKTQELATKLAYLKRKDGWRLFRKVRYRVFGSIAHHYKLNRTLCEKTVAAFEAQYNVHLPADYRQFLINMGNGGAGPGYGILPIEKWCVDIAVHDHFLSTPFPHNRPWNMEMEFDMNDEHFYESPGYQFWETHYYDDDLLSGTMRISYQGGGVYYILVVCGEESGNIWVDDRANENGLYPLQYPASERVNFNEWYNNWLNESLSSLEHHHGTK